MTPCATVWLIRDARYRQNPTVKQTVDIAGKISTINTAINRRIVAERVAFDIETVPNAHSQTLPPVETLDTDSQNLLRKLEGYMNERPIWTRRALTNRSNTHLWRSLSRTVIPYVGYMFRSGPWREAIVKYGVDPRNDPQYRIFQTMTFQFDIRGKQHNVKAVGSKEPRAEKGNTDGNSHIFDGVKMRTDGKVWQVCDIKDTLVQRILATTHLRKRCHVSASPQFHCSVRDSIEFRSGQMDGFTMAHGRKPEPLPNRRWLRFMVVKGRLRMRYLQR